jgi:MFS family permease
LPEKILNFSSQVHLIEKKVNGLMTKTYQVGLLPWLGWLVASATGLFQFLLQTSSSVMISDLERDFSINAFGVSLLSSSYFFTYLIFQIPAGIWIDYFKPRRTLFVAQLLLGLFFFIFSQSTNLWVACISRLLMGIVSAPTFVSAFYLIARTLPARYFAFIAGLTETLAMLGGLLGQALLARGVSFYGWRQTVMIMSFTAMSLGFLALFVMRDKLIQDHDAPLKQNHTQKILADLAQLFLKSQAWINGLYCGLLFGVIGAFGGFWSVSFLIKLYGVSLSQAADVSAMIFIGAAAGTPLIGWLAGHLGSRRLLMMLFSALALLTFSIINYFPPANLKGMAILIMMLGFFSSAYVLPFAVVRDITPAHMRGTAMGFINMMCILMGSPILQPLIGVFLHIQQDSSWHAYQNAFIVIPIGLFLALILAYFVKDKFEDDEV